MGEHPQTEQGGLKRQKPQHTSCMIMYTEGYTKILDHYIIPTWLLFLHFLAYGPCAGWLYWLQPVDLPLVAVASQYAWEDGQSSVVAGVLPNPLHWLSSLHLQISQEKKRDTSRIWISC